MISGAGLPCGDADLDLREICPRLGSFSPFSVQGKVLSSLGSRLSAALPRGSYLVVPSLRTRLSASDLGGEEGEQHSRAEHFPVSVPGAAACPRATSCTATVAQGQSPEEPCLLGSVVLC